MVGYPKLGDKYYGWGTMGTRFANGDPEHHCAGCNCNRNYWTIPINPRTPHKCPVCNGQKIVSTPPCVPGDQISYSSTNVNTYPCPVCDGEGIVWD